ncbi:fungalysin family metallopeptidase (M36) [Aequorivita sublithincola DSM 14238]|uniref:Fungalysin family metallopeptidase (M36) n=1 Tax=Aequorivita sublithincola (strain DSM 14238 / LMG 21431 / ACAM 643 / 9-3) TaxID=746697 RepID=I3YU67_AEQSU|nr:T9SS-dependent M36 family metallopeptidase [Aequorivita sublithincola]AFL80535.1 fungalysin family metallopeptidase (M36) [Aequorivita sublithincola DSM 14238]
MKKVLYLLIIFAVNVSFAQDYSSVIKSYLQQNRTQYSLQQQDISGISIASQTSSKSMKVQTVYAEQRHQGIKLYNSVSPFVIKNGAVVSANLSFTENIAAKVNSTAPSISAVNAISKAATALGIQNPSNLKLLETTSNTSYIFSNGGISLENIPVELVYQKMDETGALKLSWDLSIYLLDASHYYNVRIDALTGELLDTNDWVVSCNYEGSHSHSNAGSLLFSNNKVSNSSRTMGDGSSYRVFPLPLIAPNEGVDQLVIDPSDATASPFGWHDWDGSPGAEFTETKGNNVLANEDKNGNNGAGATAEGGTTLTFDFPFNLPEAPNNYLDAAITNLFYMNNMMHDIFYLYGFDEESGNFQKNNYGNPGLGNDFVVADAQDGSGSNNANFSTPPDGGAPRMQMYLWSAPGAVLGTLLTVNDGSLAGIYYGADSNFAPALPTSPITANLAVLTDNAGDPHDGCDPVTNGSELNGKIVLIRRGSCAYKDKTIAAQNEGAVAIIVVNDVPLEPLKMGGNGSGVTIPAIMIYQSDGEALITALLNGDTISATLRDDGSGNDPFQRDGDLDNVIIAHEYGHGISNRLTGGPSASSCLQNDEQMGEGWSDYFGLMLTMKPGDAGTDYRGIGTYAIGEGVSGRGIRTKFYNTDFAVNDFTYNNIKTQAVPHGVGSVWATMLWDLTWDLIDQYGFDPDVKNGTGGNNIALQLVIDGLKLQPCSPGFVDGRDAILEADQLTNGGANRCIIWRAFAKRGLGESATQGSSSSRSDGVEAFDVPTDCIVGVSEFGNLENNFIVYPNPSNGAITIKSRSDVGEATIAIFDMNGRKVFNQKVELQESATINASGLTSGIYLMQINSADRSQTTKLIIN